MSARLILSAADVRRIAKGEGYTESTSEQASEVLLFNKSFHESDLGHISLPVCVEAYISSGNVACYLPHPRQRAWRLFHFQALYSEDSLRNVLMTPYSDHAFSYHLSELFLHPKVALPVSPPPCSLSTALDRQITLINREISDLQQEKQELKSKLNELSINQSYVSSEDTTPVDKSSKSAVGAVTSKDAPDIRSNSRSRGNEGIWSIVLPDAQELFSRLWSAKSVASVTLGAGFVLCYDDGSVAWADISPLLESKLKQQGIISQKSQRALVRIRYIVLGDEGNFYVKFDNGRMEWCGQDNFGAALRRGVSEKHQMVERVAFSQDGGWLIIWSDRTFEARNIPDTLQNRLGGKLLDDGRTIGSASEIKDITMGPNGEWFIIYRDHSVQADNLPDSLYKCLSQIREKGGRVRSIAFGENRSWFVRYWDGTRS